MSRRKNGVRKDWRTLLTKISTLKKKQRKNPDDQSLNTKIQSLLSKVRMPKKNIKTI
tara:strand:+ start:209 stop:379 length:171 start_codon:yes stop_codon:yes gene_type:complete